MNPLVDLAGRLERGIEASEQNFVALGMLKSEAEAALRELQRVIPIVEDFDHEAVIDVFVDEED